MAQQINLYSPILLTPKRYFSALAMAQSLAVLALGLAALCAWSVLGTRQLHRDLAAARQADQQEKQRLQAELARRPTLPAGTAALEAEVAAARQALAERQARLAALQPLAAAARPSALLRVLAQTVPASAWLTEVRIVEGRVELAGVTQQPESLRPWLAALAAQPALAGQSLRTVKVERRDAPDGGEAWAFRVVSGTDAAAGGTR